MDFESSRKDIVTFSPCIQDEESQMIQHHHQHMKESQRSRKTGRGQNSSMDQFTNRIDFGEESEITSQNQLSLQCKTNTPLKRSRADTMATGPANSSHDGDTKSPSRIPIKPLNFGIKTRYKRKSSYQHIVGQFKDLAKRSNQQEEAPPNLKKSMSNVEKSEHNNDQEDIPTVEYEEFEKISQISQNLNFRDLANANKVQNQSLVGEILNGELLNQRAPKFNYSFVESNQCNATENNHRFLDQQLEIIDEQFLIPGNS